MVNCIQQFFFYPGVPPSHPPLSFSIAGASPSYTLDCLCFSMVLNNPVYNFSKNCRADIRMNNILVDTRVPLWLIIEMPFFFKIIYLFIYLFILFMAVLGPRFCARAFSSCGERGPLFIAVRGPLTVAASLVAEHRLQMRRLSNCGSRAQLLRGMWDPPRPGLELASPALAGRLSTTAPPGKP